MSSNQTSNQTMRALVVTPDGTATMRALPARDDAERLSALQDTVGGYVEAVPVPARGWRALCDDEGAYKPEQRPNMLAAQIMGEMGAPYDNDPPLVGVVVFVGNDGEEFTDVPLAFSRFVTPNPAH